MYFLHMFMRILFSAQRVENEGLKVVCIPTSFQARQLIVDSCLKSSLSDLAIHPKVILTNNYIVVFLLQYLKSMS